MQGFRAYDNSVELYNKVRSLSLPRYVQDQLERAAFSVPLNLAEGAAKATRRDKIKYYRIAYGSVREVQSILRIVKLDESFKLADRVGAEVFLLMKNTGERG